MVSYPHHPKSGHITCYLNRTIICSRQIKDIHEDWERAYRTECFYRGLRVLLELERDGQSQLCIGKFLTAYPKG